MSQPPIVKSAGRALALIELFDELQRPASIMEISRALGCPQSSTSMLLKSMVALGYCDVDPATRTYVPTVRAALLGLWLDAPLLQNGSVVRLLNDINQQTGEHILLALRQKHQVRYVYTLRARYSGRPHIRTGTIRRLGRSGAGNLFLSSEPDQQIAALVRRLNADERDPAYRIELKLLMDEVADIRRRGYSLALNTLEPGIGGISVLLPRINRAQPMAIVISSLSEIIAAQHEEFFCQIREGVRRHLTAELPVIRP